MDSPISSTASPLRPGATPKGSTPPGSKRRSPRVAVREEARSAAKQLAGAVAERFWSKAVASDGREYFYHLSSHETAWELPPGAILHQLGSSPSARSPAGRSPAGRSPAVRSPKLSPRSDFLHRRASMEVAGSPPSSTKKLAPSPSPGADATSTTPVLPCHVDRDTATAALKAELRRVKPLLADARQQAIALRDEHLQRLRTLEASVVQLASGSATNEATAARLRAENRLQAQAAERHVSGLQAELEAVRREREATARAASDEAHEMQLQLAAESVTIGALRQTLSGVSAQLARCEEELFEARRRQAEAEAARGAAEAAGSRAAADEEAEARRVKEAEAEAKRATEAAEAAVAAVAAVAAEAEAKRQAAEAWQQARSAEERGAVEVARARSEAQAAVARAAGAEEARACEAAEAAQAAAATAREAAARERAVREAAAARLRACEARCDELDDQLHEANGTVRVYCRVRPMSEAEAEAGPAAAVVGGGDGDGVGDGDGDDGTADDDGTKPRTVVVKTGGGTGTGTGTGGCGGGSGGGGRAFVFDRAFGGDATHDDVFDEQLRAIAARAARGGSTTLMAYGQTGSGKTHTVLGLLPLLLKPMLEACQGGGGGGGGAGGGGGGGAEERLSVRVGVVEVYREEARDLLLPTATASTTTTTATATATTTAATTEVKSCSTLHHVPVADAAAAEEVVRYAAARRVTADNGLNACSSRSHLLIHFELVSGVAASAGSTTGGEGGDPGGGGESGGGGGVVRGALHLVDLAGSERLRRTEATGERRAEGVTINKSLSALGDVMAALAAKAEHVPYRNATLTKLLQPGLSKGCRVVLLLTASPAAADAPETAVALAFGARARTAALGPIGSGGGAAGGGGGGGVVSAKELARVQKLLSGARQLAATQQREAAAARQEASELNGALKAAAETTRRAEARAREAAGAAEREAAARAKERAKMLRDNDELRRRLAVALARDGRDAPASAASSARDATPASASASSTAVVAPAPAPAPSPAAAALPTPPPPSTSEPMVPPVPPEPPTPTLSRQESPRAPLAPRNSISPPPSSSRREAPSKGGNGAASARLFRKAPLTAPARVRARTPPPRGVARNGAGLRQPTWKA